MLPKIKMALCMCVLCILVIVPTFSSGGEVISVLGKAEVQIENGWKPLEVGDSVTSGAVISTGFRSQVVLQVGESTITVQALSRLTLEQLIEKEDSHESEVFLDIGSIRANVAAADNKRVGFTVNTPIATAAVRGTELEIDTNSISVISGTVAVTSRTEESDDDEPAPQKVILVQKGSTAMITANAIIPPQTTKSEISLAADPVMSSQSSQEATGDAPMSPTAAIVSTTTTTTTSPEPASVIVSIEATSSY